MTAMKPIAAVLTAGLMLAGASAKAGEITVVSWGGAYTKSQVEAYQKPWMAKTGHKIKSVDAPNPAAPIKAQVRSAMVLGSAPLNLAAS